MFNVGGSIEETTYPDIDLIVPSAGQRAIKAIRDVALESIKQVVIAALVKAVRVPANPQMTDLSDAASAAQKFVVTVSTAMEEFIYD